MLKINHIWFDFSDTIAFLKKERHDRLRYETYSLVTGKPANFELATEYEELYRKYNHSNAAVFRSIGQPADFWSEQVNDVDPKELYELSDPEVPKILKTISQSIPISIFSNIELEKILLSLTIDTKWFTNILSAKMVKEPKPALDGFYKMVELSAIPAQQILYIGDDVGKDVQPAKKVGIQAAIIWKESDEADHSFKNFQDILNVLQ
ncbi:MAG: HAD hydrolase-like protein [Patescibacteria group bacterium]|nr:HAD hydrolase-like protein [Patescibacteria group bacterium]MDD5715451.1 HAD hydrolase-like protein [Patescibacteria group bacterium]